MITSRIFGLYVVDGNMFQDNECNYGPTWKIDILAISFVFEDATFDNNSCTSSEG